MKYHITPGLQEILDARDENLFISKVKLKEISKSPYNAIWRLRQCGYVAEKCDTGYRIEGLGDGGCDGFEGGGSGGGVGTALIKNPCTTNNQSFSVEIDSDKKKLIEDFQVPEFEVGSIPQESILDKAAREEQEVFDKLEKQHQEFEKPELWEPITKVEWTGFFVIVAIAILALVTLGLVIYG